MICTLVYVSQGKNAPLWRNTSSLISHAPCSGWDLTLTASVQSLTGATATPPASTLTIPSPENGHTHLLYALKTSRHTAPDGKIKPLRYAAAVENVLRKKTGADAGYSGLICKNPNHSHWKIAVWQPKLYSLDWLADSRDLNAANDKEIVADYDLGRNCTLFDKIHKWAYNAICQGWPEYAPWLQACVERAKAYNLQFSAPLDENEVMGIAKSVAKWTSTHFSKNSFDDFVRNTHTPELQSVRWAIGGKLSGLISRGGWRPLGVKNKKSISNEKPWISLGVSRSTWYRRYKYE